MVPKAGGADKLRCNLEIRSGSVEIKKVGGECEISTTAASVQIAECKGKVKLSNRSGGVEIGGFEGELSIDATSGGIEVENFRGSINLVTTSGDVRLTKANFRGRDNNIETTSGNIEVGVANDDPLSIFAETKSGEISTPQGEGFEVVRDGRRKNMTTPVVGDVVGGGSGVISRGGSGGKSFVEGRFGQLVESSENGLSLSAKSGRITITRG